MSLRLLIDMNLSPEWVAEFSRQGWPAVHWSAVGDPRADDALLMAWAKEHEHVVFTHDLDFGAALALTRASAPSIVQVRGPDVLPEEIGLLVGAALRQHELALMAGALVVVEARKSRVRVLPLLSRPSEP